jgi:hypothetical protein
MIWSRLIEITTKYVTYKQLDTYSSACVVMQIIRYSFFGTKELLGSAPSWLQWLR